jgi:hypothetical protein
MSNQNFSISSAREIIPQLTTLESKNAAKLRAANARFPIVANGR